MTVNALRADAVESSVLLITGAAGTTGDHAARLLLESGYRVRAMVHRFDDRAALVARSRRGRHRGRSGRYRRRAGGGRRCARGVLGLSHRPGALEATTTFAQAAAEAGVAAVVNMSQISARGDAASDAARTHWLVERVLDWSPVAVTHLRPTFFAEWFLLAHRRVRPGRAINEGDNTNVDV
jgi:NAD(P)H dehydrogenase (quinone)